MAESLTVAALRNKRDQIERTIASHQKKIEAARRGLSAVNATIRLFQTGQLTEGSDYVDTLRLFKRGEIYSLCRAVIEKNGPQDTRELALQLIAHRKLDTKDVVLRRSLAYRVVQAMRMQAKRGKVKATAKRKGAIVWEV